MTVVVTDSDYYAEKLDMGKPFSQELKLLQETFAWTKEQEIDVIQTLNNDDSPVIVVGSGGSLSACFLAVSLLQSRGILAKAITPLELQYLKPSLKKSRLIFISSGGKNTDIIFAFKTAIESDPVSLMTICMRKNTPLGKLSAKYSTSKAVEYSIPAGKDGFLATNSLIAYFTIFIRGLFNQEVVDLDFESSKEIEAFSKGTSNETTICVLYAGWGQSVAVDIESKFTEAALGNVHIADYRNFGHGRHHWFAKRSRQSAIVALVTPEEELLATKTLQMLPNAIPKLILRSRHKTPYASLELLIKSFHLVSSIGQQRQIDPGRPGVPDFGRKLYNLKFASLLSINKPKSKENNLVIHSILKKAKVHSLDLLGDDQLQYWLRAHKKFVKDITKAKFGAVVFDYDGTLCRPEDRFNRLSKEVKSKLNEILHNGFVIAVITGRGQSARKELQSTIDKSYWNQVIIGYYNGADIGLLNNDRLPNTDSGFDKELRELHNLISGYEFPFELKAELRPKQLTIEINNNLFWKRTKPLLLQLIMSSKVSNIQLLESSHSMDIIKRPDVSKLNVLQPCVRMMEELGLAKACLCIGDRGQWPGNDFELLATKYSLSVDEVSSEPEHCWNLVPAGIKGVDATLQYLNQIEFHRTHFNFVL